MKVYFMCAYYSQWAHVNVAPRSQVQWDAFKFVRAVKSRRINGHLTVPWKQRPHERIDSSNVGRARAIFGYYIDKKLTDLQLSAPSIIPVPSKDGLLTASSYRSNDMIMEALEGNSLAAERGTDPALQNSDGQGVGRRDS